MISRFLRSVSTLLLLCVSSVSFSQVGCPAVSAGADATVTCATTCVNLNGLFFNTGQTNTYTVQNIAYSPNSFTTGTPILVNIDDTWSGVINLPFNFCFFGINYNRVLVGSNGIISFDLTNAGGFCPWDLTASAGLPDPGLPTNSIMGVYQDIDPTFLGDIYYSLVGTAPCRKLIVSFTNIPYYGDPNSVATTYCGSPLFATSQIVLYETTNAIDVYIQNKPNCTGWNSGLAICGIQNANGSVAFTVPGGNNTVWTASNRGYRFLPSGPSIVSFQWMQGSTVLGSTLTIQVCPAATTTYTAQATYNSCNGTQIVVTDNVTVTSSNSLQSTVAATQQVSCYNGNDGAISASIQTGQTPITYLWSNNATSGSVSGLSPGTYTVTITDANGCSNQSSVTLANPPQLLPGTPVIQPALCPGSASGSVTVAPTGGTAPYTYAWSPSGGAGAVASNLQAGNYTCTVTDSKGCTATVSATVNAPAAVIASASFTTVSCNGGSDGSATASASGGTAPYTYAWNTSPTQITATASGLPAGNFTCVITDNSGCTASTSVSVTQPSAVSSSGVATQPSCTGSPTGSVTVSASGGTGPYTYAWQPGGSSGPQLGGLAGGNYVCTVTDSRGCTSTSAYTIIPLPVLTPSASATDAVCFGSSDGTLSASLLGGTAPINFSWSPGNYAGANVSQVPAGSYTVLATDASGCTATATTTVNQPPAFSFSVTASSPGACAGTAVTLTATGGVSYLWSDGSTGTPLSVTPAQSTAYTVIGTDVNGCSDTQSVTVAVYPIPVAAAGASTACEGNPTVFNNSSSVSSGNIAAYSWSFGDGGTAIASQPNHTYGSSGPYQASLFITSDQGCTDSVNFPVTVLALPVPSLEADVLSGCPPLSVNFQDLSVSNGGTIQSWNWVLSDGSSFGNPAPSTVFETAGWYDVSLSVTTSSGCTSDTSFLQYIEVYSEPVADFMPEPGQASIFDPEIQLVETSYDAVNWQWDFGDSTYSNLSDPIHLYTQPGTYTVTLMVQNVNGCMDTVTRIVIIEDETTLWIPSAFSPNGDGKNEVFLVRGYGFTDFRLDIFDRWGLLLFSSDNAETGWDGTYNNGKCETDVYVYRVRFRDADNTPHDQVGRVTVVY